MGSVRRWTRVIAGVGLIVMSGSAWLLAAPQGAGAAAGASATRQETGAAAPALRGDVDHGRYIVERIAMCGECHSTRNEAGDVIAGTRFRGGHMPAQVPWPADWPVQVPRIAGLPGYSDAEALRLLTSGAIKRNGQQARAPMPRFRMTPQDAADVIAFLRSM